MFESTAKVLNKRKKASLVILCLIVVSAVMFLIYKDRPCTKLECLSMEGLEGFKIQEVYQNDDNIYRALLSKDNDLLRVDIRSNISESEGKSSIHAQITRIKALFENAASPYPGEISDEIECSDEYKPVFSEEMINGIQVSSFIGFLNDRLVLGACTADQAVYRGMLSLFQCPNLNQLYQVEMIAPREKFSEQSEGYKNMLQSISCRK